MKRKTGISLMIALLMIISTFAAVSANEINICDYKGEIIFEKKVLDEKTTELDESTTIGIGEWVDEITTIIGATIEFKLSVTYKMDDYYNETPISLRCINITDELPSYLEYVSDSASITPTGIAGNKIYWNLTDILHDEEILTITFNAKVLDVHSGEEYKNIAVVTAKECYDGEYIYDHEESDDAAVLVKDDIYVEKQIWNGEEWNTTVDSVILNQILKFKITVTYYGPLTLNWLKVEDYIPICCVEYADEVTINGLPNKVPYIDSEIGLIRWHWTHEDGIELVNGDVVTIEFSTKVISYCEEEVCNEVIVSGGDYCTTYSGSENNYDLLCFNCMPPEPIFEKKVHDGTSWAEEANVYVGDPVSYKISLIYYGVEPISNIKIIDELPCCLEYLGNSAITKIHGDEAVVILFPEPELSPDKRTIIFYPNVTMEDGDELIITYDALVVDITSPCGCHGINLATYFVEDCEWGSDTAKIASKEKPEEPEEPEPEIIISLIRFGIGQIKANIKNIGESDLSDIEWSISVTGGLLKKIDVSASDTISELKEGDIYQISTKTNFKSRIVRKLGKIEVLITAKVDENIFEETAKGFAIGRIIIILK